MPLESGEEATPCRSDQVAVTAFPAESAVGHRAVTLMFALAGGAEPCTLTGYPWVDSGAGGSPIHARPTPRGYGSGAACDLQLHPSPRRHKRFHDRPFAGLVASAKRTRSSAISRASMQVLAGPEPEG
ncbi:DUF4232 domain-containing protein [Mycobacterium sp. 852002-51971_SCH5477799-a]|uniref:DUF4232 domain-containing protein n=1 Tax=Mycobacterium sp. 852002-51971_SCH5477799-a TaxID=1834106 RepID=UPI000A54ACBD|nr:DUF4232 domain-containing protein [Mycobacterium sp. 852002-51971_SCH5477799-a]